MSALGPSNRGHGLPPGLLFSTIRDDPPPPGFGILRGQQESRTGPYARIFDLIGTQYGAGNGWSTFHMPDARGRILAGADDSAGRIPDNDELGDTGGLAQVTLSIAEIPPHDHEQTGNWLSTSSDHAHAGPSTGAAKTPNPNSGSASGMGQTEGRGGGESHENMPPYLIIRWIVTL